VFLSSKLQWTMPVFLVVSARCCEGGGPLWVSGPHGFSYTIRPRCCEGVIRHGRERVGDLRGECSSRWDWEIEWIG
jgi:hypothetical protein